MRKFDWKALGSFVSVLLGLFTLVRETFSKIGVGIEIIEWLVGDGRKVFVDEFLTPLGQKFMATQRWKFVNATTIMVNLGVLPRLPFDTATIEWHRGEGWVRVQKRKDGLYVNGRKVVLYLSERQKGGQTIKGHELRDELTGKPVLNANLLDALYENTHLIPEELKKDAAGNVLFIYFWDSGFSRPVTGGIFVRCLFFSLGSWFRYYDWLGYDWDDRDPAALLASKS